MYPVSLKLSGFKSFAEPTEIAFTAGMSAVVGPNGCGKSNIVEALRWVMGESSARQLRGFEMDEMIFAGSSERPPFSRAEVTLTLENLKTSSLPSHVSVAPAPARALTETGGGEEKEEEEEKEEGGEEVAAQRSAETGAKAKPKAGNSLLARLQDEQRVVLSRRIETGGGSTYRINGKEALARDVQTLCADIGLGANASAIIAQGRVAALVEAKPAERRQLIEEAAGVRGLFARRSEAMAMMENTRTTLSRVEDRLQEIAKRLQSLTADEARAERYRDLSQQIRRWQAADLAREQDALEETAHAIEKKQKACEQQSAQGRAAIASSEAAFLQVQEKHRHAQERERESAVRCQRLAQDAVLLEHSQKENIERKKNLKLRQSEHTRLCDEQQRALEEAEGLWKEAKEKLLEGEAAEKNKSMLMENKLVENKTSSKMSQETATIERRLKQIATALKQIATPLRQVATALSDFDRQGAIYAERLNASRAQKKQLEKEIAKLSEKIDKKNQTQQSQDSASQNSARDQQTKDDLQNPTQDMREEVRVAETLLEEMQSKTLPRLRKEEEALSQERETLEKGYRAHHLALMEERDKNRDLHREASSSFSQTTSEADETRTEGMPLVVDWNIPEKLALALFGALGEDLFATLENKQQDKHKENSTNIWRIWKRKDSKKNLSENSPPPPHEELLPPLPAGVVSLAELLGDERSVPAALRARLACIGLVDSQREGETLWKILLRGQRLVTRDGYCWRWDGLTSSAELAVALEQRFRAFLQKEKRKEAFTKSEENLARTQRDHEVRVSENANQILQTREQMQGVLEEQARQGKNLQTLRKRLQDAETAAYEREGYHARQTQLAFGLDDLRAKEISAEQGLQRLGEREKMVREQESLTSQREILLNEQSRLLAQQQREENLKIRAQEEQRVRVATEQRLRGLKDRYRQILEGSIESLRAIEKEATLLEERPLREQKELVEIQASHRRAEIEHRKQKDILEQASGRVARLDEQHRMRSAKNAELEKEAVRLQAQAEPLPLVRQRLVTRALEEMDCSLSELRQRYDLDASFLSESPELQKAARRATQDKRARLGEINFTAKQVLQSLGEEHEQTQRQHADVVQALEKLSLSVRKLEEEASGKLVHVQQEAGARFARFIERLFGGGEAKLFFSDPDDPISSGLEIRLALPGKRLKSLSVLSGGEQALAAIALVLAVFSVAGGGLCILDEVDAALDDTNVARFCDLLEDIARQYETRFLVITHHRHTMSRALQLYGVAMPEPGCSRIVSVALEEAVEQARPAAE